MKTVDNYYSGGNADVDGYFFKFNEKAKEVPSKKERNVIGNGLIITLSRFQRDKNNQILSFFKDEEKRFAFINHT